MTGLFKHSNIFKHLHCIAGGSKLFRDTVSRAIQLTAPSMVPIVQAASEAFQANTSGFHLEARPPTMKHANKFLDWHFVVGVLHGPLADPDEPHMIEYSAWFHLVDFIEVSLVCKDWYRASQHFWTWMYRAHTLYRLFMADWALPYRLYAI